MFKQLSWIVSLAALTTVLGVATAGATNAPPVSVSLKGTQTVVDEAAGTSEMHGSLIGIWQITKFVPRYASASQFVGTGKELFDGCLDSNGNGACDPKDPAGTLKMTFMYWASFDPATGALIHGNCVHPIDKGTGSFKHASGVVFMEDTPVNGEVVTTYTGTLDYQAPKSGQAMGHHRTLASASKSSAGHGGGCGAA